jgi:cyclic pyranopterin phosphate synthase
MTDAELSHYDDQGRARMVDVGGKDPTIRHARATGRLDVSEETLSLIADGRIPKGDPFEIARVAGITAAKRTADLIPLCHPLRLTFIDVSIRTDPDGCCIRVESTVAAEDRTGVEMEALVACTTALLTVYDMLKAVDREMALQDVRLIEKTGGKSDYHAAR